MSVKKSNNDGKDETEDAVRKGTVLDHFVEKEQVTCMITELPALADEVVVLERAHEQFLVILDRYQEQPHLLDPHLDELVGHLFQYVRDPSSSLWVFHMSFKYLYTLSKVRGPKMMVRYFSHEVADLQPTLDMLKRQNIDDYKTWETRYVLLLWLSFIIIIPFDLSRLDGTQTEQGPIVDQILTIAKSYFRKSDKTQDAAGFLLARFVSRPDLKKEKLPEFLDWSLRVLSTTDAQSSQGMTFVTGVLSALSSLFKHGKREDLIQYAPVVFKALMQMDLSSSNNTVLRKLQVKLLQRLGMTFLPPRIASWRYQRGNRCLVTNIAAPAVNSQNPTTPLDDNKQDLQEEEYDIPEETEDILGRLLQGLKDKDTVVRWSAAKGVGRICGRLPLELANEVIASLLDCLTTREGDGSWHGGCLALAELGRRGLLLPDRLQEVVPVVLKALAYDERRGAHSVGSNVRDAACYVCWSFARAYDPAVLLPYVTNVASALLATALFDRETNCRKAASAAFQENVGRQGTLPHGIVVMTTVDYYSVGNISNSYLELSVKIASFPEYTAYLINHLLQYKLFHWDSVIRELSSQSLHKLVAIAPDFMKDTAISVMLEHSFAVDLGDRHGALLGMAELSTGFCALPDKENNIGDHLTDSVIQQLIDIVPKLERTGSLKGVGGEVMRPAVLHFIRCMCGCHLPVHNNSAVLETWQLVIEDNFSHGEDPIRDSAASAFKAICCEYYTAAMIQDNKLIDRFIAELQSDNRFSRMGFPLGLGNLPSKLLSGQLDKVIGKLIQCATTTKDVEPKYTESRRDSIKAIMSIVKEVEVCGTTTPCLSSADVDTIYEAFLVAMGDYTSDSRGDVGALVREASMCALDELTRHLAADKKPHLISPTLCCQVVQSIVQQCCERIDRTRGVACNRLLSIIQYDSPAIPHVPHHEDLLAIFNKEAITDIDWTVAHSSFPLLVQLLALPSYTYHTLLGMIASVGGLTESTVRHSSSSLLSYLRTICTQEDKLADFCDKLTAIFKDNLKNTRVTIPLLETVGMLLSNSIFDLYMDCDNHPFLVNILNLTKEEIKRTKDAKKLLSSINVFCSLLQFHTSIRTKALNQLMLFMGHAYPRVRKNAADQLYTTLLTYDQLLPEDILDNIIIILADTTWSNPLEEVRIVRNNLCELLELPVPKQKATTTAKPTATHGDEFAYRDLVERAGY